MSSDALKAYDVCLEMCIVARVMGSYQVKVPSILSLMCQGLYFRDVLVPLLFLLFHVAIIDDMNDSLHSVIRCLAPPKNMTLYRVSH